MRANAVESDKKLLYPRKNFQLLAKHGFLGLIVPKELGGMGENHVTAAMAVETIARYGCPSTAMCYTMHLGAVAAALFRHHDIRSRSRTSCGASTRIAWSARCPIPIPRPARISGIRSLPAPKKPEDGWKVRKKASWTTSGGFADWYIIQTTIAQLQRQLFRSLLLPHPGQ